MHLTIGRWAPRRWAGWRWASWRWARRRTVPCDLLVMVNHLGDDEVQELFGERRVKVAFLGEGTQVGNLHSFTLWV